MKSPKMKSRRFGTEKAQMMRKTSDRMENTTRRELGYARLYQPRENVNCVASFGDCRVVTAMKVIKEARLVKGKQGDRRERKE